MATKLSKDTLERLGAELEELTTTGRVEIARAIQAAREVGDLSENGDYDARNASTERDLGGEGAGQLDQQADAEAGGAFDPVAVVGVGEGGPSDVEMSPGPVADELPQEQAGDDGAGLARLPDVLYDGHV